MGDGISVRPSAARLYATITGVGLVVFGLAGFFYSASFSSGEGLSATEAFGLFYVNGWANLAHLLAGVIGVALAGLAPRLYCLGATAVWGLLAAFGYFGAHGGELIPAVGSLIPAGSANNLLALLLGFLAFAAYAASGPPRSLPSPEQRAERDRQRKAREQERAQRKERRDRQRALNADRRRQQQERRRKEKQKQDREKQERRREKKSKRERAEREKRERPEREPAAKTKPKEKAPESAAAEEPATPAPSIGRPRSAGKPQRSRGPIN